MHQGALLPLDPDAISEVQSPQMPQPGQFGRQPRQAELAEVSGLPLRLLGDACPGDAQPVKFFEHAVERTMPAPASRRAATRPGQAAPVPPGRRAAGRALPSVDLEGMTVQELVTLREAVGAAIMRKQEAARAALLDKWKAEAFEALLGGQPAAPKGRAQCGACDKAPLPPKYRNRATGKTWTGRGREPAWIKGKSREEFRV